MVSRWPSYFVLDQVTYVAFCYTQRALSFTCAFSLALPSFFSPSPPHPWSLVYTVAFSIFVAYVSPKTFINTTVTVFPDPASFSQNSPPRDLSLEFAGWRLRNLIPISVSSESADVRSAIMPPTTKAAHRSLRAITIALNTSFKFFSIPCIIKKTPVNATPSYRFFLTGNHWGK